MSAALALPVVEPVAESSVKVRYLETVRFVAEGLAAYADTMDRVDLEILIEQRARAATNAMGIVALAVSPSLLRPLGRRVGTTDDSYLDAMIEIATELFVEDMRDALGIGARSTLTRIY